MHSWEADWIKKAKELVCNKYSSKYEDKIVIPDQNDENSGSEVSSLDICYNIIPNLFILNQDAHDTFDNFANTSVTNKASSSTCHSELDEYLQLPVENVKDALKWWVNNRMIYPNLACMALDYLSIPGANLSLVVHWLNLTLCLATSTAIKHVFSHGQQLLHFTHNHCIVAKM